MRALICGAGISGLTSAIALRRAGIEPVVFERARGPKQIQVGGCIHVWHNGANGLQRIGVAERLLELAGPAATVSRAEFLTASGKLMYGWSVSETETLVGAPTVGLRRATLHRALLDAAGADVRFARTGVGFTQDEDGVRLALEDGGEETGDVLIAADGMRSVLRKELPGATEPRYAGYVSWQAIARVGTDTVPIGLFRVVWGRGARFLYYRIGPDEVYWEGTFAAAAGGRDPEGGRREAAIERFAGWPDPVGAIIEASEAAAITRADMYDRPTAKQWGSGRVTAIGDAAHAMTNAQGQGANQAIEDALVLARCLSEADAPPDGLRRYEAERIPRTNKFAAMSWRLARASRLQNPVACAVRDRLLTIGFRQGMRREHPKDMDYGF